MVFLLVILVNWSVIMFLVYSGISFRVMQVMAATTTTTAVTVCRMAVKEMSR